MGFTLKVGLSIYIVSLLLFRSYIFYNGKLILRYLKEHYHSEWEEIGSPEPFLLIPHQKWSLFLKEEHYEDFGDDKLAQMCVSYRRMENIFGVLTVSFFVVVGVYAIWDTYFVSG